MLPNVSNDVRLFWLLRRVLEVESGLLAFKNHLVEVGSAFVVGGVHLYMG